MKMFNEVTLMLMGVLISPPLFSQKKDVPKGWHLLDKQNSGFYGISATSAYDFVKTKKLKSNTVIVAVIDTGIDTTHEDLRNILWRNPGEIPGNGIDDDKNGYADDIYGWNFLGSRDGTKNVTEDSDADIRLYYKYWEKWGDKKITIESLSPEEAFLYRMWKRAEKAIQTGRQESLEEHSFLSRSYKNCRENDSIMRLAMDKEIYTGLELDEFLPNTTEATKARKALLGILTQNVALESTNVEFLDDYGKYLSAEKKKIESNFAPPLPYRDIIVNDNYDDINDKYYGNNNVMISPKACLHGTLVSGIIAASRNNAIGAEGIADNVKIMLIRATDEGSEHDKDIALAIRYAVDNGAQIINMSFGNSVSAEKKWVDDAVQYAQDHSVLIVHAAGNIASNYDINESYPFPLLLNGSRVNNWITVGSSGDPALGGLVASFSNYGKKEVDVFAPGIKIYTTAPGNTYQSFQGTSTSSSVVTGLAAFLLQYYPRLSAPQLKMIIEKTVQKPVGQVKKPGAEEWIPFSELCRSGGIVNALEAIKLASVTKGNRKNINNKPIGTFSK